MRTGLVVDSSCDLPESFLERNHVLLLPYTVSGPEENYIDQRLKQQALAYYRQWRASPGFRPKANAFDGPAFTQRLLDEWIYHYDQLLIIAPHLKISDTLTTLREHLLTVQPKIEPLRKQAQLTKPFRVRVVESGSGMAGYGLSLYEALRLTSEKARSADQIKSPMTQFAHNLETFILPGEDALAKGYLKALPFGVSWLNAQQMQMKRQVPIFHLNTQGMKAVTHCSQSGHREDFFRLVHDRLSPVRLHNRLVAVSYAGNPADLRISPAFQQLNKTIEQKQGRLLPSIMSPTNAAMVGAGAVTVAFAHEA